MIISVSSKPWGAVPLNKKTDFNLSTRIPADSQAGVVTQQYRDNLRSVTLSSLRVYYPLAIARDGASRSDVESAVQDIKSFVNRLCDEALSLACVQSPQMSMPTESKPIQSHPIPEHSITQSKVIPTIEEEGDEF